MGAYGSPETYPYPNDPKEPRDSKHQPEQGLKPIYKYVSFWVCLALLVTTFLMEDFEGKYLGLYSACCVVCFVNNLLMLAIRLFRGQKVKMNLLGMAISIALFLYGGFLGMGDAASTERGGFSAQNAALPTRAQYDQFTQGMTYNEACDIMGAEGVLYHESGFEGENGTKSYYWGTQECHLYASFFEGKMQGKGQNGIPEQ